jgi:septum formation protein
MSGAGALARRAPQPLVLASSSPQRRAILEQLGVAFHVEAPDVEEVAEGDPRAVALENAQRKARAVEGERVLGVDTEVVLDGRVFGKPGDAAEAEIFLRRLSGRTHEVMSGIALRLPHGEERTDLAVTNVRFRLLEQRDIDWYLRSEEWRDRAGGYAIQGRAAALVAGIEGDYWNVVGLPVAALVRLAPELIQSSVLGPQSSGKRAPALTTDE